MRMTAAVEDDAEQVVLASTFPKVGQRLPALQCSN